LIGHFTKTGYKNLNPHVYNIQCFSFGQNAGLQWNGMPSGTSWLRENRYDIRIWWRAGSSENRHSKRISRKPW
jgi:hypothetical protein